MRKVPSSLGIILVLILTIVFFPHGGLTLTRNISSEIESKLEHFIKNVYLPASGTGSLGIAIVGNNGEQVYTAGFGMADRERNISNGNDTQFLIGSVTKSFTSLVVVKTLHEQFPELGEKVLDTPIRKLLAPQLLSNFTLGDRFRSEQVTFGDLLAHRVCLGRNDLPLMAEAVTSTKEIVFRQRYAKEACGFRTKFQYNNQMYIVAGELIGAIAGRPFEDLATELLVAIGMHNSSFIRHSDDFFQMPHRAMPYYVKDNVTHPINPELIKRVVAYNAAGGLFVTPNDMAEYLMLHLNSGKMDKEQVIPAEPMSWLTKPAIHMSSTPTFKTSDDDLFIPTWAYGLGLFLGSYDGWQFNFHGGYFPPYSTQMMLLPGLQLGIFSSSSEGPVLLPRHILEVFIVETLRSSSGRGRRNATEEAMKIWDKFEKRKAAALIQNATLTPPPSENNTSTVIIEEEMLQINSTELVGEYGMGDGGEMLISERPRPNPSKSMNDTTSSQLYLSYGKWTRGWLKPWSSSNNSNSTFEFEIEWDTDIVQDVYAAGGSGDYKNIVKFGVNNGALECNRYNTKTMKSFTAVVFRRGVNLSTLPEIPWAEESCGAEEQE